MRAFCFKTLQYFLIHWRRKETGFRHTIMPKITPFRELTLMGALDLTFNFQNKNTAEQDRTDFVSSVNRTTLSPWLSLLTSHRAAAMF
jgi:hypothetical protein